MFFHELGHVLLGVMTGGKLSAVDVTPWRLSSTLMIENPRPSAVIWGGFLSGWGLALGVGFLWRIKWCGLGALLCFWSGYCWLAFGCYLSLGGNAPLTDTGQLLKEGWSWGLLIFVGASVGLLGYCTCRHAVSRLHRELPLASISNRHVLIAWLILFCWWLAQWLIQQFLQRFI